MYLPYLRNRTNEVFAVLESAPILSADRLVVPLFNLVDQGPHFAPRAMKVAAAKQPYALIVNTAPDEQWSDITALLLTINAAHPSTVFPAFEISPKTTHAQLVWFAATFSKFRCIIVHRTPAPFPGLDVVLNTFAGPLLHVATAGALASISTLSAPSVGVALLTDAFLRQSVNGAYPVVSPFENYAYRHPSMGFVGVSDFATVGDYFKKGGGQASHVALHLTEPVGNALVCNHFVSNSTPKSANIRFKYVDSLTQLRAHVLTNPSAFATTGAQRFVGSHSFPGLGWPKRWSIRHHLELMHQVVKGVGATPLL